MKKYIICLTAALIVLALSISCSSSKSDDYDYETFVSNMIGNWEGYHISQKSEDGRWISLGDEYVSIQFSRTGTQLSGTGTQICYKNGTKQKETERSNFNWYIQGEHIYIDYEAGWSSVDEKCADCTLTTSTFKGFWHNSSDPERRFEFNYIRK